MDFLRSHLPRLNREAYRGHAFVHWTFAIACRKTGWLTPGFHETWKLLLVHVCHRYALCVPLYVLMPDHVHVLCAGLQSGSDQSLAIPFLRKHLAPLLAPAEWERQPYDHVLRPSERDHGAFQSIAQYIADNPVRAQLTSTSDRYPYLGCCFPGYPTLRPTGEGYWELFWRIYNRQVSGWSGRDEARAGEGPC